MNVIKFRLQNEATVEYNDSNYDQAFELANNVYRIQIKPTTDFWRFGIRFSSTNKVKFFHPTGRYNDQNYPNIELVAGDIPQPSRTENPNHIHLSGYYLPNQANSNIFNYLEDYTPTSTVDIGLFYDDKNEFLYVKWQATPGQILTIKTPLPKQKIFKLFAWADWHPYLIDCTVMQQSIYLSPSNQYWLLKLDSQSWNINALAYGFTTSFDTFLPETLNQSDTHLERGQSMLCIPK